MALRSEGRDKNSHLYSSDSNELSDVDIGDDEELDLDGAEEDDQLDHDNHDDDLDDRDDEEEPEDPEDVEDYNENDDPDEIDENDPETQYDLQDGVSEDSDEDIVAPVAPKRSTRPTREIKKRQLTFYEEDDLLDSEEEAPTPKKKQTKSKAPPKRTPARNALRAAKKDPDDFDEFELEYKPPQKLTERQRAKLEDDPNGRYEDLMFARMDQQLLALNRKTAKRIETEEQIALRRAENARKRAHYKVKQLEEAKRDTLNKLLKRRATKTREKDTDDDVEEKLALKPRRPVIGHPSMLRWVSRPEGSLLAASEPVFFSQ